MSAIAELADRRRSGMKPGLESITAACEVLGNPQRSLRNVIHVAGTNGKGAVSAILDSVFKGGRYTSPHLVRINERFFLNGRPVDDERLERVAEKVLALDGKSEKFAELTFFESLTAVAYLLYAESQPEWTILETGLGGRLDATNICHPRLCVITRIGLDHCDWLGNTIEQIAAEKAGIIKPGVPVVLARNEPTVCKVIAARARELGSPFYYAPEMVDENAIPADFPLAGDFNRENAITALAALRVLGVEYTTLSQVTWPGRFQQVGKFLIDGAHNPPAARALVQSLGNLKYNLVFGACADKDVDEVLSILKPHIRRAFAIKINNPRSLTAEAVRHKLRAHGIDAVACASLSEALSAADDGERVLVCGSLFLAGEAIVELGAYPWGEVRYDPSEILKV